MVFPSLFYISGRRTYINYRSIFFDAVDTPENFFVIFWIFFRIQIKILCWRKRVFFWIKTESASSLLHELFTMESLFIYIPIDLGRECYGLTFFKYCIITLYDSLPYRLPSYIVFFSFRITKFIFYFISKMSD